MPGVAGKIHLARAPSYEIHLLRYVVSVDDDVAGREQHRAQLDAEIPNERFADSTEKRRLRRRQRISVRRVYGNDATKRRKDSAQIGCLKVQFQIFRRKT